MNITQPTPNFPRVPADQCACCGRPIKEGYDVPFIGIVGPKCVLKFAALAQVIQTVDGLTFDRTQNQTLLRAVRRLKWNMQDIGFPVTLEYSEDGNTLTLHVGPRTRKHAAVVKSFKERREEFIRDLLIAEGKNGVVSTEMAVAL